MDDKFFLRRARSKKRWLHHFHESQNKIMRAMPNAQHWVFNKARVFE